MEWEMGSWPGWLASRRIPIHPISLYTWYLPCSFAGLTACQPNLVICSRRMEWGPGSWLAGRRIPIYPISLYAQYLPCFFTGLTACQPTLLVWSRWIEKRLGSQKVMQFGNVFSRSRSRCRNWYYYWPAQSMFYADNNNHRIIQQNYIIAFYLRKYCDCQFAKHNQVAMQVTVN